MRYLISFALATVSPLQSSVHVDPTISIQFNSTKVFCSSLELLVNEWHCETCKH